ncbi:MAG TPA: VOC family protein [Segeticoccus sp.]|uniref:VOC family protein n=1 Tax=Segeticoccus sp. TaxID=2706531 RepID=UPI002D801FC5|nr:VOC family protein [Segeticoccus sp.]HET8599788.1 VOC family protein [Segeticoccus sp.]
MLRLRGITLDTPDPEALAGFWRAALGYDERPLWDGYAGGTDPHGRDPHLTFQRSAAGRRLHLDLYSDDPEEEAGRLVALGAERLRRVEEGDTWWWVLRDPDGNEFCIIAAQGAGRQL